MRTWKQGTAEAHPGEVGEWGEHSQLGDKEQDLNPGSSLTSRQRVLVWNKGDDEPMYLLGLLQNFIQDVSNILSPVPSMVIQLPLPATEACQYGDDSISDLVLLLRAVLPGSELERCLRTLDSRTRPEVAGGLKQCGGMTMNSHQWRKPHTFLGPSLTLRVSSQAHTVSATPFRYL